MADRYILLDANVTAAYYLPRSSGSQRTKDRSAILFDSVRSGSSDFFFYLPNFCVAEVFSVFMKHAFGAWNRHVKGDTIDPRCYNSLVQQFESDIHNGWFIYHYELARYHVLAINLVAPVDHYFQISRVRKPKPGTKKKARTRPQIRPMGTFDHLIIAMGIHLAHVHGPDRVVVVSSDRRLTDVLAKCKSNIPMPTKKRLRLDRCDQLTGRTFSPSTFPEHVNLAHANTATLKKAFGTWPLPVGKVPKTYRYLK